MNAIESKQFNSAPRAYDMSPAERDLRIELAAAFRVGHHYRWNLQINNHITARIPDRPGPVPDESVWPGLGRDYGVEARDDRFQRQDPQP